MSSQSSRRQSKSEVDTSGESGESPERAVEQCGSDDEATTKGKGKGRGKGASNKPFLHDFAKDLAKVHEQAIEKVKRKS